MFYIVCRETISVVWSLVTENHVIFTVIMSMLSCIMLTWQCR